MIKLGKATIFCRNVLIAKYTNVVKYINTIVLKTRKTLEKYTTRKTPLSVVVVVSQRDLDNNLSDPVVNSEKGKFIIGGKEFP